MKYPKISEYVKAIQNAGANLGRLAHLSPVLDDHEEPYHMSGDSSVVFKMQDKSTGIFYVLKCFTIDPKELSDVHLQNADEQNMTESSNSSSVKFLEKELLVYSRKKEKKYPVELMEWVDEESMGAFLAADEELLTVATDEELNEAIIDEFGVKYRKDGRKLLEAPHELDGSYSIRKGTKIICDMAFYDCKSLSCLVIPDSVIGIGYGAFEGCSSLRSLVIPDSVTNLNGNPFCKWDGELKCLSPYFIYDNKVLFDKDKSTIISFRDKDTTSYVIPDRVSGIGSGAFYDCKFLESLIIPDSVTYIGYYAFGGCKSLKSLVLPDSVTSIGAWAFSQCILLSCVVLPDNIARIEDNVFDCCASLNDIVLPDSVTRIGNAAFSYCSSLSNIVIPNGVTSIGTWAFSGCSSLSNIILPDSVTRIGNAAFVGCSSLKSIVIPNGVTRIGTWTFLYCCSLSNIVIPDSVTRIGSIAFQFCYSLSTISIPDSVTRIGGRAFHDCYFPNDLKQELISRFGEKIFE